MAPVKHEPEEEEQTALLHAQDDVSDDDVDETTRLQVEEAPPHDPRFDRPTPSPWKRAALLVFTGFLFWLAFEMRASLLNRPPKVVHAKRYSEDFKFRPAASPIITETMADGRLKIRGGPPTPTTRTPTPAPTKKAKRRSKRLADKKRKAKKSTNQK